ncbi:hypothetical protein, conserved [Babesia bigemina]|uniref:Uncharacterized protein n=1 Tax=Babesia bigemina TaxID=5866 RepID=A0A061D5W6_BABBI|nr:hypothetical protein, conserved [Babesia bigemina]CDR94299.1 hypothetical protein, conserved [Babesia bigemina]|eukprot:XP_012766485.1 hypothetical protein, conserved [Babesia bigemina]
MDRHKECERVLKTAAVQQCKERGNLIRQDFVTIATVTAEDVLPVNDAGEFVRQIISDNAAVDKAVLRGACSILLDTLALIKHKKEQSSSNDNTAFDNKSTLAFVSGAIKGQPFQENSVSANLCHIVDRNGNSCFEDRDDGAVFNDFDDGFYELNVLQDDVVESSSDASASDDDQEVMNTYITSYRNRYGNQALTVLSDNGSTKKTHQGGILIDETAKIPRNLHMQQLFGVTGQTHADIVSNAFEPYYDHGIVSNPSTRENGVTHYVGGMYPPLHTYYSKDDKGRTSAVGLVSQNCLRRTFSPKKQNFADRLLQQSKQNKSGAMPFALLARDAERGNNGKDALLINETVIRHHASPIAAPIEHVAFIGKDKIRTFKCNIYTARILPNMVAQQQEVCSSLFTSEVSQGRMLSRMVQKLMRYEYVNSGTAAMWRGSTDAIAKAISNIEWGCLWQDWNYFSGGLLTEIDMQRIKQHLMLLTERGITDKTTILRNVCSEFAAHLSKTKEANVQGASNVTETMQQIVSKYIAEVLAAFDERYCDLRNIIYMDLRSINNRGFQQTVTSILESKGIDDGLKAGSHIKESVVYVDREIETKMRLELLPTHRAEAADLLSLTSVDEIVGEDIMQNPDLSGEPFLNMLSLPQHPAANARQLNITSTALDLCKKCFEGYKNGSFCLEKNKTAKGLTVLNSLVTLLKNYEKPFSGARNLRDFLGAAHWVPDEIATWILSAFYERAPSNDYIINSKGLQKLMCYILWLSIYLAGGSYTYNFTALKNVDLKTKRRLYPIFDKCVHIAGLVATSAAKSTAYTIELPLKCIPKTNTSAFGGLTNSITSYGKRSRR